MSKRHWHRRRLIASAIALALGTTGVVSGQSPNGASNDYQQARETTGFAELLTTPLIEANPVQQVAAQGDYEAAVPTPAPQPIADPVVVNPAIESTAQPALQEPVSSSATPEPVTQQMPAPPATQYQEPQYQAYAPGSTAPVPAPCNCCKGNSCTKEKKEAATAKMKGAYKGVFYANDFSYLNDKCYDGPSFFGDGLKGLMDGNLDIGGEARVRYHSENNHRGLGLTGRDDEFWLTRYRMYASMKLSENFRLYGEYLYADSGGEFFNNRPIEENRGEMQNLFLDAALTDNMSLRLGRQELLLGAQRLVSPLDWANTRRTFDGVRGTYKGQDWTVDGFFVHPVNRNAANESKIDDTNENVDFFGAYASNSKSPLGTVDAYYLGLVNDVADFSYHTLGSRVAGKSEGGTLYELEGGFQFGDNSPGFGSHSANFFTGGLGRQLSLADGGWKPTVWAWYDYASGGDDVPAARGDDGFDHAFPLAHKYLGFMDLFGRRNIHDLNFQFITPLGSKVKMILWYHNFWLDQATTPYNVTNSPFNAGNVAGDKELGQEIDVIFNINLNPRNNVLLGYSHFASGAYYETTPGVPTSADADFFYFQYQTRF